MNEIFLGSGSTLSMKASMVVGANETLTLMTQKGAIDLNMKVEADFSTIPEEYHEVFLNMMSTKYYGKVSFGDNPFSKCLPIQKKRWWHFWKSK
jgi:hypothetical protein